MLERVRSDYVEKPDDTQLIESAINGMLSSLDPHSSYMSPKNFRDMQVQTRGEFGGLGIEVTMENGVIKVVSPIDDTPAAKAGLLANDLITHLDNEQISGLTLEQAVEKMRGPVNTPITLTVVRKGKDEPFDVKVDARRHPHQRRQVAHRGRRRLRQGHDLQRADARQPGQGDREHEQADRLARLKGYVIDLRNNPGGLLDQAIAVSDDFLEQGAIVLTKGRNNEETQRANARPGDMTDGKKIAVLINGGSASASEIVAGALQDHKRATIIGTRSFGKGSVQTIIPLGANGAIRLTTARYYTPSNRSIQAKGIDPDILIEEEMPDDLKAKMAAEKPRGEASLRGHLEEPRQGRDRRRGAEGAQREVRLVVLRRQGSREGHAAAVRAELPARHGQGRQDRAAPAVERHRSPTPPGRQGEGDELRALLSSERLTAYEGRPLRRPSFLPGLNQHGAQPMTMSRDVDPARSPTAPASA